MIAYNSYFRLFLFPQPGDVNKYLLPHLIDPEEQQLLLQLENDSKELEKKNEIESKKKQNLKEFWMPDNLCKTCYNCGESFTIYRRKHHCRICGQIFCNPCSSYYIDGAFVQVQGNVRACKICFDQNSKSAINDALKSKRRSQRSDSILPVANTGRSLSISAVEPKKYDDNFNSENYEPIDVKLNNFNILQTRYYLYLLLITHEFPCKIY